jgi:hypothetical protein
VTARVCLELMGWCGKQSGPVSRWLPATPIDGTDPRALESFFRRLGIPAQSGEMDWRDLAYHTARGRPVAALVQLDGCGHWVRCGGRPRGG